MAAPMPQGRLRPAQAAGQEFLAHWKAGTGWCRLAIASASRARISAGVMVLLGLPATADSSALISSGPGRLAARERTAAATTPAQPAPTHKAAHQRARSRRRRPGPSTSPRRPRRHPPRPLGSSPGPAAAD